MLAGDLIVLLCGQARESFLGAPDKISGAVRWKTDRTELFGASYSTPVIYEDKIIVAGSTQLVGYRTADGENIWSLGGLPWRPASSPTVSPGGHVFVSICGIDFDDDLAKISKFDSLLAADKDYDGKLSRDEWNYRKDYSRNWIRMTTGRLAVMNGRPLFIR